MNFLNGRAVLSPYEDNRAGGSKYKDPSSFCFLSLSAFFGKGSAAGDEIVRQFVILEKRFSSDLLVRYPGPGIENGFREELLKRVPCSERLNLKASNAFAVFANENFPRFHGDVHSHVIVDLSSLFGANGGLNSVDLSKCINRLAEIFEKNGSFHGFSLEDSRDGFWSAIEAKPGVYGFSIDLKNLFS